MTLRDKKHDFKIRKHQKKFEKTNSEAAEIGKVFEVFVPLSKTLKIIEKKVEIIKPIEEKTKKNASMDKLTEVGPLQKFLGVDSSASLEQENKSNPLDCFLGLNRDDSISKEKSQKTLVLGAKRDNKLAGWGGVAPILGKRERPSLIQNL